MINIVKNSFPDNRPLERQEIIAASCIIDSIKKYFESLGLSIGQENLQVIKHTKLKYPKFCPLSANPTEICDRIYLSMDSFNFWCQLIFQASHEFTHCLIHRLNKREDCKASWIEETICEAMSLLFLLEFSNNWTRCPLSQKNPSYYMSIKAYLTRLLKEPGTHKLELCRNLKELHEIDRVSEQQRDFRREEMHHLWRLIYTANDIFALVYYRDFIIPGTIQLNTQKYRMTYPTSKPVLYLCDLQDAALKE